MGKFIVSYDNQTIINMDKVYSIFYGDYRESVMAAVENAYSIPLFPVGTMKEGQIAIQIIAERMKREDVIFMPSEDEVKARIALEDTKAHHITGKKTKGHGGS